MNLEASIIDQRVSSIVEGIQVPAAEQLKIAEPNKLRSLAFVYLCVKTVLDLDDEEAFDCLTEGGAILASMQYTSRKSTTENLRSVYFKPSTSTKTCLEIQTFPSQE